MEDEDGQIHLRNLSVHQVASEDDALNFLFLGDTNRSIAETPMNLASSRSHAIFTVAVESRDEGSTVVRKSKLHLVDLAGYVSFLFHSLVRAFLIYESYTD